MKIRRKYRLTIEDESHLEQVVSHRFNIWIATGLIIGILGLLLVISGLIIAFSPLRTLLPGYMKESQRSETEETMLRLDSLMTAYEVNKAYIDNFLKVIDTERSPEDSAAVTPETRDLSSDSLMGRSDIENRFISEMEDRERFNVSVLAPLAAESMLFFPVSGDGVFTNESRKSLEGIIVMPREENVQCAADGSVIALYYSAPEKGFVIVVQHKRGFVTSYTHVGTPLVEVGDNINAGQIIALSPSPDSKGNRKFSVRLWHNGIPIIPYDYLDNETIDPLNRIQSYEAPRGK